MMHDIYGPKIANARSGDIRVMQEILQQSAGAMRERLPSGGINLAYAYAEYLAECLEHLASSPETARLFCLDMPKHRRKGSDDPEEHLRRARLVMSEYQHDGNLKAAIERVASSTNRSAGAIRASWKVKGGLAEYEFFAATPRNKRNAIKCPGAIAKAMP